MTKKIKILLSNDDGVDAPGIITLADHLRDIADIVIVAPDKDRSGASNSLTLLYPLHVKKIKENVYSVDGTPTDCVHLGVTGLFEGLPDMVLSGINCGANLGDDILYSGTVAAATEGRSLGLPAVAVSLAGDKHSHYLTAAAVMKQIILMLQHERLPVSTILNVNVPDVPLSEIKGMQITRLGTRHAAEPVVKQQDPRGRAIYWVGKAGAAQDSGIGTDFHAIEQQCVSITPLKIDLTHYDAMESIASWVGRMVIKEF